MGAHFLIIYVLLYSQSFLASAFPVTFELQAGQNECLYVHSSGDSVISYYFAVQQGSDHKMDLKYEIYTPNDLTKPAVTRLSEMQGDWSFVAQQKGEYGFCFYAPDTASRIVDVEIVAAQKDAAYLETHLQEMSEGSYDPTQQKLGSSLDIIERQLTVLEANMWRYRSRTSRSRATAVSTGSKAKIFALCGIMLMISVVVTQALYLKSLIEKKGRKSEHAWKVNGVS
ncbi:LANO_0B07976g1_1 [Lachancea nothofagi CBS 11611]|uniref:LANO_0B07976g1_1 n=1 Tax=Lachancea nothofagi CBS 11611 TaxID=1266666 RepID=A0A1G4J0R8_9SACH|nr:LANO_0B07976g1_1 [Lachancea nothofagi CBS 11611]